MITAEQHQLLWYTAGPLRPYLEDPDVMKVRVTSRGRCFIEVFGRGKQRVDDVSSVQLDMFLAAVAPLAGKEWRDTSPRLSVGFTDLGWRIQAARPPVSPDSWMVLRKHPKRVFPLNDFVDKGILTQKESAVLTAALDARQSILVSGSVGSAKTSLLNAMLDYISAHSTERFVILEDEAEIICDAEEAEFMSASSLFGASLEAKFTGITENNMQLLARDLLRADPGWVIFGEVRGGEALDMIKAFQVGHPGLATIHGESAVGTLQILEQRVQEVSVDPQRAAIAEAIDLVVHMQQMAKLWRATDIIAVENKLVHGEYVTRSLVKE